MLDKQLKMSNAKFIIYMSLFMLIGACTVGIPLLQQSKGYYDDLTTKENELAEVKAQSSTFTENSFDNSVRLINDYNDAVKDRNTLLRAIEKSDGDIPNWQPMKCKDGLLETPIDC